MNRYTIFILLLCFCGLTGQHIYAQPETETTISNTDVEIQIEGSKRSITIIKKQGEEVYHDEKTQTIDFFFVANDNGEHFWDFYEKNLKVTEKINDDSTDLDIIFQGRLDDKATFGQEVYQVKTRSTKNYHRGKRTYNVIWHRPDAREDVLAPPATVEKDWSALGAFSLVKGCSFWDILVSCLLLLAVILLVFSEIFPLFHVQRFKRKYVFPYSAVQKRNERKLHPITGQPIPPGELVVKMCDKEFCNVPLSVWKRKNYQCSHCPDQCDGNLDTWSQSFFTQKGGAKKLNWLWFGAVGGALAWIANEVLNLAIPNIAPQFEYTLLGAAIGFGYAFMLSWVQELGQGSSFSYLWFFLRTLIGTALGALIFWGFSILGADNLFVAIAWVLFCTLLGLVLSIQSAVLPIRGILSGLFAGLMSALIYYGLPKLFTDPDAALVKMITLIATGAVLGYFIIRIVQQLDKIELEVIRPSARSGLVFSLDKHLKAGSEVIIGKDMKTSTVRVKWEDDHALGQHAVLQMNDNKVFISPLGEAELWIEDDRLINGKKKQLKGGEIIQLSRSDRATTFKYLQKA